MSGVALFLVHTRAAWVAVMMQGLFYGVLRFTRSWKVSGMVVVFAVGLLFLLLAWAGQTRDLISGGKLRALVACSFDLILGISPSMIFANIR
jgi:hypothetical protein